jgi:hypothetical protein
VGLNLLKDLKTPTSCWGFLFSNIFCIFTLMKKYTFILAFGALFALVSCGSGSTTNESTDSTTTQVDSTVVTTPDSTVVETSASGGTEKPEMEAVK